MSDEQIPMRRYGSFSTVTTQVVEALTDALGEKLVAVVLYGSQARGDANDYSDWDFLVVAAGLPKKMFERHMLLKRLLPSSCRAMVSFLAKTPDEFAMHFSSLYLDVALDGVALYDPQQYVSTLLARLRKTIEEKGLYRERLGEEMVWHWQQVPPVPWTMEWGTECQ